MKLVKIIKNKINNYNISKTEAHIINVWEKDTTNIGDITCSPCLYFKELQKNSINISIMNFKNYINLKDKVIIVGGGGLLLSYFEKSIDNIIKLAKNNRVIFWGVGFDNYIHEKSLIKVNTSDIFKFAIRDFDKNIEYEYVPCASCMSDLFDKYKSKKDKSKYGLYLHRDYSKPIKNDLSDLPCLYNTDVNNFEEAINFLASYEVILTNSFHGLYWGTLLGKKIILLPWVDNGNIGFSNKFNSFKFKPIYCKDWTKYKDINNDEMLSYPESLNECRLINKNFFNNIKQLLA